MAIGCSGNLNWGGEMFKHLKIISAKSCVAAAAAPILFLAEAPSYAQTAAGQIPDTVFSNSIKAIFVLFVLALVLESALAVIFNWRPFVETFNARATRPLISFVV